MSAYYEGSEQYEVHVEPTHSIARTRVVSSDADPFGESPGPFRCETWFALKRGLDRRR